MNPSRNRRGSTRAVGVVVPVHDEEELLASALGALGDAFAGLKDGEFARGVVVVLDSCSDSSAHVANEGLENLRRQWPELITRVIDCQAQNVGVARAYGCAELLRIWTDVDAAEIWLATTDADSRVPATWLATQLRAREAGADLWTGRVRVDDWTSYERETRAAWMATYESEGAPIHGASMGFNAFKYLEVGGYPGWESGEDRGLCGLLVAQGAHWAKDSSAVVSTSSRRVARAPLGFSHALELVDARESLTRRDAATDGSPALSILGVD